jgi:hypothetical protein
MKTMIVTALALTMASLAAAEQPAPRSDVEARLAALEKINVTAYKPPADEAVQTDPKVDAILERAEHAEAAASTADARDLTGADADR